MNAEMEAGLQAITGRLGRFQLALCSLLCATYVYQAMFNMTYVFTTMRSEHRCLVPECETADSVTDMHPPWLWQAVPTIPGPGLSEGLVADPCRRFEPRPLPASDEQKCGLHFFSSNRSVQCDRWVYPNKELSIMTEWDMACSLTSDWLLALVGTANGLGRALGLPLFGYVSDVLGRRTALLSGLSVSCAMGLARSFAPDYAAFIAFEFLDPLFYDGIGGAAFIMGLELVPTPARGSWSALSHIVFAAGLALLGGLAWVLPRWRIMLRVVYGSALLCLAAMWFVPESVRWLASKGRTAEAFEIINKAARMNRLPRTDYSLKFGHTTPDRGRRKAQQDPELTEAAPAAPAAPRPSFAMDMKELFGSRVLVLRLVTCCSCWVAIMFVYDGLAVYSVALAGHRYLNFVLVVLVEVPAALITWKVMAMAGRRATLVWSLIPAAACCVAYHFLPSAATAHDVSWSRTGAVVLAKLFVTVGFTTTYVLAAELFPTRIRNTMYALSATCGRFGSALSPQMPLLTAVMESLPLLVFGAACFSTALLALTLPETARAALPNTVGEAEAIGNKTRPAPGATTPSEATGHI